MDDSASPKPGTSLSRRLAAFVLAFIALQAIWASLEGTQAWRAWMETMNVGAATVFINLVSPDVGAMAEGTRIRAAGGGLNLLQGCDGVELLLLLSAAFLVAPLRLAWRIAGWVLGLVLAWLLNVGRLVALFYAWRSDPAAFDLLHNYIGPIFLVVVLALYMNAALALAAKETNQQERPA